MNDRVFIDTNVWVYYFQAMDEPGKTAARKLIDNCFSYAVISVQVLGELFSVMTKKEMTLKDLLQLLRLV
jgi:predicted nucleic acid-binding protein